MVLEQGGDGDPELFDALYRSFGRPVRRRLLVGLLEAGPDGAVLVPEDVHVGEKRLDRLAIELRHNHLPVLEGVGLIRWDREAGVAGRGERFSEVRPLIAAIDRDDPTATGD